MKIELKLLQHQFDTTFLYITHDQSEALVMSDAVAVMNAGRFEQIGAPQELFHNPKTGFVAGFVGDSNRWPGRVVSVDGGLARVELAVGGEIVAKAGSKSVAAGTQVEVFVRPEVITFGGGGEGNKLSGTADSLLFNGAASRILVRTSGGGLVEVGHALRDGGVQLKQGDSVDLRWNPEHSLCFPLETAHAAQ